MDVRRQYVAVRVVAFVRGERGFNTGDLACLQAASSVDDLAASVENDRVEQPVFLDVGREGLEVLLVGCREEQDGRMEMYGGLLDARGGSGAAGMSVDA